MMGRGGYFNNNARRSGGFRRTVIYTGDAGRRSGYLKILKARIAATGLTGADLQEVFDRLDATETDVLRDCLERDAVGEAERRITFTK